MYYCRMDVSILHSTFFIGWLKNQKKYFLLDTDLISNALPFFQKWFFDMFALFLIGGTKQTRAKLIALNFFLSTIRTFQEKQ